MQDVEDLKTRRARLRREKEAKLKAAQDAAEADRAEQMRQARNALADVHARGLDSLAEMESETVKLVSIGCGKGEEAGAQEAKEKIKDAEAKKKATLAERREELRRK